MGQGAANSGARCRLLLGCFFLPSSWGGWRQDTCGTAATRHWSKSPLSSVCCWIYSFFCQSLAGLLITLCSTWSNCATFSWRGGREGFEKDGNGEQQQSRWGAEFAMVCLVAFWICLVVVEMVRFFFFLIPFSETLRITTSLVQTRFSDPLSHTHLPSPAPFAPSLCE